MPRDVGRIVSACYPNRVIYTLVFVDLDGTLVGADQKVSPRTLVALNQARAQGCTVVIATARNRYMVEPIAAQWPRHSYVILSNGAIIADWETGAVIEKTVLPAPVVRTAARVAHELQAAPLCFGVDAEQDGGERIYTDGLFALPAAYSERNQRRLVFRANLETETCIAPVGMGAYGTDVHMKSLAAAWRREIGNDVAVFDSFDPKYGCWCAFLNAKTADKAEAAKRVADLLGVKREQTMAIGDHLNDLGLLRWAGLGVSMGDGHEEARAASNHVTGTLSEDGAAQAIERFILEPTPR